jgi:uncharacterized protein YuzE
MEISAHYDHEAKALQIALVPCTRVDGTLEARPGEIMLDMCAGEVVGIEILNPARPLRLARVASHYGFAALLDDIYSVVDNAMGITVSGSATLTHTEARWTVADAS